MKKSIPLFLVLFLLLSVSLHAATNDPTGNWKGTLEIGQTKLRLLFKIAQAPGGSLAARMDSLDQGVRDIPVDYVIFKDNKLELVVNAIQGSYEGALNQGGTKVTGKWQQGSQTLPLTLERTKEVPAIAGQEPVSPADLAASKLAAQKLAGTWNGTLAAGPANLHLALKISKSPSGTAIATMDSVDQGAKDIPLSAVTCRENKVHFEAHGLGGVYDGTLGGDSATIAGSWQQAGQTLPLDFKKASSSQ